MGMLVRYSDDRMSSSNRKSLHDLAGAFAYAVIYK